MSTWEYHMDRLYTLPASCTCTVVCTLFLEPPKSTALALASTTHELDTTLPHTLYVLWAVSVFKQMLKTSTWCIAMCRQNHWGDLWLYGHLGLQHSKRAPLLLWSWRHIRQLPVRADTWPADVVDLSAGIYLCSEGGWYSHPGGIVCTGGRTILHWLHIRMLHQWCVLLV